MDKQYLADFLFHGIMHFGSLEAYRNTALPGVYKTTNTTIGDLDEGVLHREYDQNAKITIDNRRVEAEYSTFRVSLYPNAVAFCFTEIPRSSLYSVGSDTFKINRLLIKELMKNFPRNEKVPVVLTDVGYIWEMVKASAIDTRSARGPIMYTDNQALAPSMIRDQMNINVSAKDIVPFTKKLRYKDQYEYRFLLEDGSVLDDNGNLEIGSLKEHAHVVRKLEDILIQVKVGIRKRSSLEIYRGLKYKTFSELALMEFLDRCRRGKFVINIKW